MGRDVWRTGRGAADRDVNRRIRPAKLSAASLGGVPIWLIGG